MVDSSETAAFESSGLVKDRSGFNQTYVDMKKKKTCSNHHERVRLYLHVFVFDLLTGGDAVGDVEVDELWGEVDSCGQPDKRKNMKFKVCL